MRIKDIKIKTKLIATMLLVSLIPLSLVAFWALEQAKNALLESSYNQLTSMRSLKGSQIEDYLGELENELKILGQTVDTVRKDAFERLEVVAYLKKEKLQDFINE